MEGKRLINSVSLKNLLSYGSKGVEVELQPLNVLIGANGSGKSNFLEAIRLLHAAPRDLTQPIIQGGGISEWLWKGGAVDTVAEVTARLDASEVSAELHYQLSFASVGQRIQIVDEAIENFSQATHHNTPTFFYRYHDGQPRLIVRDTHPEGNLGGSTATWREVGLEASELKSNQSILSQRNDPFLYPETGILAKNLDSIRLYTEAGLGRLTAARRPQDANLEQDYLLEDAGNLALVLNSLQNQPAVRRQIMDRLRQFYDRAIGFTTPFFGGSLQLYIEEMGLQQTVPASRLSDGTIRYLCLLVILCHPTPPPLVCIEEPELGLHPDIIPTIAELLVEASQRTQLIVTTHSDMLVSALSDVPEAILVCERDDDGSRLERLEPDRLKEWLEKYTLGGLWLKGQLGGTRW